jgi:hypothetical protein
MPKLKLLKIAVQPSFVLEDDDGYLAEVTLGGVTEVAPRDWPSYPVDKFREAAGAIAEQLGAEYDEKPVVDART